MRKIRVFVLLIAAVLALAACGRDESGEEITIRFATTALGSSLEGDGTCPMSVSKIFFMREIETRTNGRITVNLFPDGQLGATIEDNILGLQNGTIDMFSVYHGGWFSVTQAFAGFNVPYLFYGYEEVWSVLDSDIGRRWMERAYEDTGARPMAFFDVGFRHLTNSAHTVTSPEDLIGMRMRTMPDAIHVAIWEALGANVTPIPWTALPAALEHGLVDAQENTSANIVQARLYEHQPYMTITNHNYTATIPAAGPIFWGSLSEADQELISRVMLEAQHAGRRKALTAEEGHIQYLRDAGILITELTSEQFHKFQAATRVAWPMIADVMGQNEFDELVNFVRAMQD